MSANKRTKWGRRRQAEFWVFLLLTDNNGSHMPRWRVMWALKRIESRFPGGGTVHSRGKGWWPNRNGRQCRDVILPVQVVVPAHAREGAMQWFDDFRAEAARELGQEEIFILYRPAYVL